MSDSLTGSPGGSLRTRRLIALLSCAVFGAGCYTYRPIEVADVRVQADVRARLSAEQARELDGVLPTGTRVVEGRVLEQDTDSFLMLVPVLSEIRGTRLAEVNQRLNISRSGIVEVEMRELDRFRTGAFIGAGAATLGFIVVKATTGGRQGDDDRPGPGPSDYIGVRVPFALGIGR